MLKYRECRNLIEVAKPAEDDQASITVKSWLEKDNHSTHNSTRSMEFEVSGIVRDCDRQWRETWRVPVTKELSEALYQSLHELVAHVNKPDRAVRHFSDSKSIEVTCEVQPGFLVGWMDDEAGYYGFTRFIRDGHTMETKFKDFDALVKMHHAVKQAWPF